MLALLLGLRHAADPDHLAAVTTLVAAIGLVHGLAFVRRPSQLGINRIAPVLGLTSLGFGAWYGLAALSVLPGLA